MRHRRRDWTTALVSWQVGTSSVWFYLSKGCRTRNPAALTGFILATGDFPSEDYEAVRDMFIGKYGQPYNIAESEVQNRLGTTFQQERLLWIGQRGICQEL